MKVDIVVPCYNENENLEIFFRETNKVIEFNGNYEFNYIFVDDGSEDGTLDTLKAFAMDNSNVKYISFSRNFGKEASIYAGLKGARGDFVVIIDADMQNPPNIICEMLKSMEDGYDCCTACRKSRKGDNFIRILFSKFFYKINNLISEVEMPDGAGDFRMMNRVMLNAVLSMSEVQRFSKGIFSWVGFKNKWIYFENVPRAKGKTKWSFLNLFSYALDGITAFSTLPLKIASFIGTIVSLSAFIYLIYVILTTLKNGIEVPGYATIVTLILFIGGIIIMSCGILGEYLSKIYMEVKNRPIYIVRQTNLDE